MAVDNNKTFIGDNDKLVVYNNQVIKDLVFVFVYDDDNETDFDFPQATGQAFLRIYDERLGRQLKEWEGNLYLVIASSTIIANIPAGDLQFEETGKLYYEVGYVQSGGYEIVLRYGELEVI